MKALHHKWVAATGATLLLGGVLAVRAVTEPKNDFRFAIMGDRTGGATAEIYGRVWREVDLLHPDFVINVGDTIQGRKDEINRKEWQDLRPIWQRYNHYPLYFTPGNHDIWSDTSRAIYEKETGQRPFYGFNYQEAHFTVLDNSQTTDLSEDQIKFLTQDLEANKSRSPKFIFFHKPYWIPLLKLGSGEFVLHQVARKYGVTAVINGHGHQFVRMVRDGIVYMEVGSSGGSIKKGIDNGLGFKEGYFYHHVMARVRGSKVVFTVKEIDGPVGKGRMFNAEDWTSDGPKFDSGDPAKSEKPQT